MTMPTSALRWLLASDVAAKKPTTTATSALTNSSVSERQLRGMPVAYGSTSMSMTNPAVHRPRR